MPRHEPSRQDAPAVGPGGKVRMRLDPDGRWQVDMPVTETRITTEAAERPPQPDDPRPAHLRNVPPLGGGF